ncbi:MAG: DUF2934 domain-containing protein [Alphaproteobacteria bacterium]
MATPAESTLTHAISLLAYKLWEAAGRPEHHDQEFWLFAEHELKAKPKASGPIAPAGKKTPRSSPARKRRLARQPIASNIKD